MSPIAEEIKKIEALIKKNKSELDKINGLLGLYPDLEMQVGRWDKVAYCSASVNSIVTDYESRYNCGCCADSPLEVWLYINTEFGKVYSSPAHFFIGKRSYEGGDKAYADWENILRKKNIPENLIEKLRCYFPTNECLEEDCYELSGLQ